MTQAARVESDGRVRLARPGVPPATQDHGLVNGELAQALALVAHGNAWLHQPDVGPPPSLDVENSTFQYVRSVSFVPSTGAAASRSSAGDAVASWLWSLRRDGMDRLRLVTGGSIGPLPDHLAVAFAGSGSWHVLATGATSMLWTGAWTVGDRSAPDRRIWDVRYTGREVPPTVFPAQIPVESAQRQLVDALVATQAFARQQDLEFWTDYVGKQFERFGFHRSVGADRSVPHLSAFVVMPTRGMFPSDARRTNRY